MERRLISSGAAFEDRVGYSRAVVVVDLLDPRWLVEIEADALVARPGRTVMILASEKQAGQGRRERQYAFILARLRTQIRRRFAAARARCVPRAGHRP